MTVKTIDHISIIKENRVENNLLRKKLYLDASFIKLIV